MWPSGEYTAGAQVLSINASEDRREASITGWGLAAAWFDAESKPEAG